MMMMMMIGRTWSHHTNPLVMLWIYTYTQAGKGDYYIELSDDDGNDDAEDHGEDDDDNDDAMDDTDVDGTKPLLSADGQGEIRAFYAAQYATLDDDDLGDGAKVQALYESDIQWLTKSLR